MRLRLTAAALFLLAASPAEAACPPADRPPAERLRAAIPTDVPAAVVVTARGVPALCAASGPASATRPITPDTAFDIGAIARPITAMAVLRLVDMGKLTLDDPVSNWIEETPADKAGVTVRQLLLHTSGLPRAAPGDEGGYTPMAEGQLLEGLLAAPLVSKPGEAFAESSAGYNLLAVIVSRAADQSFRRFVAGEVLARAGVKGGYDPAAFEDLAESRFEDGGWSDLRRIGAASGGPYWALWGAGGLYMSASDLAVLMDAFVAGRIVSPERVREAVAPGPAIGSGRHAGLVWDIVETPAGRMLHAVAPGELTSGEVRHYLTSGVTVATLSNAPKDAGLALGRKLGERHQATR